MSANDEILSDDDLLSFQPFTVFTTCPECDQRNPISTGEMYEHRNEQLFRFDCYCCNRKFNVLSPLPALQKEIRQRREADKTRERVSPAQNVCDYCLKSFEAEDIYDSEGIGKAKPCYCSNNLKSNSPGSTPPKDSSDDDSSDDDRRKKKSFKTPMITIREQKKYKESIPLFQLQRKDGKPMKIVKESDSEEETPDTQPYIDEEGHSLSPSDDLNIMFSSDEHDSSEESQADDVVYIKTKKNEDEVEFIECSGDDDGTPKTPVLTRAAKEALRKSMTPLFPKGRVITKSQRMPISKRKRVVNKY